MVMLGTADYVRAHVSSPGSIALRMVAFPMGRALDCHLGLLLPRISKQRMTIKEMSASRPIGPEAFHLAPPFGSKA